MRYIFELATVFPTCKQIIGNGVQFFSIVRPTTMPGHKRNLSSESTVDTPKYLSGSLYHSVLTSVDTFEKEKLKPKELEILHFISLGSSVPVSGFLANE